VNRDAPVPIRKTPGAIDEAHGVISFGPNEIGLGGGKRIEIGSEERRR
jgi:hypothetical protein